MARPLNLLVNHDRPQEITLADKTWSVLGEGPDLELALECPDCSQRWLAAFDIATFLWHEIDVWARRTLREVHALARAYAWREPDVLALSPTRRQIYLELSGA